MEKHTRRSVLTALGATVASASLPSVADAAHPDARLLRLGVELETAWADERRIYAAFEADQISGEEADKAPDASRAVVDEILRWPATTLEGLRVKARAVSWCYCGDEISWDDETTDLQLALSIVNDLVRL